MIRFLLASALSSLARFALRIAGRAGTTLPGRVLVTVDPRALARLRNRVRGQVICISATNGKTTTATLLAGILRTHGMTVVHNAAGANLRSGLVTTLAGRSSRNADVVLLETDEATLAAVATDLRPDIVMLGNLFRDQLDRYGELEVLADRWAAMLQAMPASTRIVANADDPLIASLSHDSQGEVRYFGVNDEAVALPGVPHAADSTICRRCGSRLAYTNVWLGQLGEWRCPGCGDQRPQPAVVASHIVTHGLAGSTASISVQDGSSIEIQLKVPGLYNVYNALAAIAVADLIGVPAGVIASGVHSFAAAFGRFERVPVPGGGTLTMLLVKNPTGLNEIIRTLIDSGVDLRATMFALNDGTADGHDVSWVWDADLAPLIVAAPDMVASGGRAAELAIRLVHSGAHEQAITVLEDVKDAMFHTIERARTLTDHGHAYALLTYTAMLELRGVISRKGWTAPYWDQPGRGARTGSGVGTGAGR